MIQLFTQKQTAATTSPHQDRVSVAAQEAQLYGIHLAHEGVVVPLVRLPRGTKTQNPTHVVGRPVVVHAAGIAPHGDVLYVLCVCVFA